MNLEITELSFNLNNDENKKQIGLQFAPNLQNTFQIEFYNTIKQLCPSKSFFIIGDTSYGSCCCDEITAKHLNADTIIRIGSSCFTLNQNIPIYFLFENIPISNKQFTDCYSSLNEILSQENNNFTHIIVIYSEKVKKNFINKIRKENKYNGLTFADIEAFIDNTTINKPDLYGRYSYNFPFDNETTMIYIGNENDLLLNELSLRFISKIKSMYLIDIANCNRTKIDQSTINTCLYRRFNLIEKAKQANTFGILIGSLSINSLNEIITNIKNCLQLNKKKCYTFLLGKLTEEKLCNFSEYIDCFVLIACPFNPAFHTKIGMKPIVSSLDIKIAFDSSFKWDSSYSFDVNYIQHSNTEVMKKLLETKTQNEEKDNNKESALEIKSINDALIPIFSQMTLTTYEQRKFKGLKIEGEKTIKPIAKGKRGIPIKYEEIK